MHPTPTLQRNPPVTVETPTQQNPNPSVLAFSGDFLGDMPSFELDFDDNVKQRYLDDDFKLIRSFFRIFSFEFVSLEVFSFIR